MRLIDCGVGCGCSTLFVSLMLLPLLMDYLGKRHLGNVLFLMFSVIIVVFLVVWNIIFIVKRK